MTRTAAVGIASLLGLSSATPAAAESQLWLESGIGGSPARRVDVDATAQVRFDQDISRFAAFLPEVSARYRLERWLRVGGSGRLEYERDSAGELVVRSRVAADARARVDVRRVRLAYRLMVVEQFRPTSGNQLRSVLRNRVDVGYRGAGALRPWGGIEWFHVLDDLDQMELDRTRITAGTAYDADDREVEVYLRLEIHADPAEPTFAILGLGYHYEL